MAQQGDSQGERPPRQPGELTFTGLLLALSLFLLWQAHGISGFESLSSAGMFPMLSTATMVVTGAVILLQCLRRSAPGVNEHDSLAAHFLARMTPPAWLGLTLAVCLYMLALPKLGFVLASFLFLLLSMRLLGSQRWLLNVAVSAISLAAVHLVFRTLFSVVLPQGSWLKALLG